MVMVREYANDDVVGAWVMIVVVGNVGSAVKVMRCEVLAPQNGSRLAL